MRSPKSHNGLQIMRISYSILFLYLIPFVLAICFILSVVDSYHNWGDDFAGYILQTQSLLQNRIQSYLVSNQFALIHSTDNFGPLAYPWGLPLILSIPYYFFGLNFIILKMPGILCLLAFLLTLIYGFKEKFTLKEQLVFLVLFASNTELLIHTNYIQSDLPFLLFSTIGIVLINKVTNQKEHLASFYFNVILLSIVIACAALLRTNGIIILFVLVATFFFQQLKTQKTSPNSLLYLSSSISKIATLILPLFVVGLTFWIVSKYMSIGGASHFEHYKLLDIDLVVANIFYYAVILREFWSALPFANYIYLLSLILFSIGILFNWKKFFAESLYIFLTFTLYVFWPHREGLRFLFPILPFYISFIILGIRYVLNRIVNCKSQHTRMFKFVLIFLSGYCIFNYLYLIEKVEFQKSRDNSLSPNAIDLYAHIKNLTEKEAIIGFVKPRALKLFTGRQSIKVSNLENIKYTQYVVIVKRSETLEQLDPFELAKLKNNKGLDLLYQNADFALYKLDPT